MPVRQSAPADCLCCLCLSGSTKCVCLISSVLDHLWRGARWAFGASLTGSACCAQKKSFVHKGPVLLGFFVFVVVGSGE